MPERITEHKCGEPQPDGCAYSDESVAPETLFARINNTRAARDVHFKNATAARESARKFQELAERRAEQVNVLLRIARERGLIE